MTKRALVAGVNDYANWNSGVTVNGITLTAPNLSYCVADAEAFAQLLTSGFSFAEVQVLKDSQVTSSAILDGVKSMLASSVAGDVACFYFSGHGGRIPETPASASTRYYESIIPYDATMVSSMDIAAIASSLEPSVVNLTLVLDSCHSGGLFLSPDSRGATWDSAAAQAFEAACTAIVPWIGLLDVASLDGNVTGLKLDESGLCKMTVNASLDTPENAKATLFSACDYQELSREGASVGHGFFTQSIIDVVNACDFSIAHTAFLDQVRQRVVGYVASGQTPQLRGRPVRLEENFLAGWNYSI
jgi:hypothetical protein